MFATLSGSRNLNFGIHRGAWLASHLSGTPQYILCLLGMFPRPRKIAACWYREAEQSEDVMGMKGSLRQDCLLRAL